MRKIIYHVATSLDHYIADEEGKTGAFPEEGDHVDDYLESLKSYDTVIMGRKTYEFGYGFGLEKGQPAYPHMDHYIFSKTLTFERKHDRVNIIRENELEWMNWVKKSGGTPVYLCGGGKFAGWLLDNKLIDELKIKLNPVILGDGIPLFGDSAKQVNLALKDLKKYDSGVALLSYDIRY